MTPEIALYLKTLDQVIQSLSIGRAVTLSPSEKLVTALAEGKGVVEREMQRRQNAGRKGGRKPKLNADGTLNRSTLTMRATRARRRKKLEQEIAEART